VWGEHEPTMRELGEVLRLAARSEEDILVSKNRPADVALLVANTSEVNSRFFKSRFGPDRIALFTALMAAQIPVDVIDEEEVIEDETLNNYRALYVVDPHVDSRAQSKIKEWVHEGGTLWASYAALSRQEYDEPASTFDEVFGLRTRGTVEPIPDAATSHVVQ